MPLAKIVTLNAVGFGLCLDKHFRWYQFLVSLPMIGKKYRYVQPL
jgi:hypothetical protein